MTIRIRTSLDQLNLDLSGLAENTRRSVVQITNGGADIGAGTILRSDGLIITNAHVVKHHTMQITLPDGRALPARLLAHAANHDLAALGVEAAGLPALKLGDSRRMEPGQWVMALGHPWGIIGAATAGVVIGVGSEWPAQAGPPMGQDWIVVSLHLRPGHSGGPLIDALGQLVGINSMMNGPDVGVAVPAHVIRAFLRQALGQKQHAYV